MKWVGWVVGVVTVACGPETASDDGSAETSTESTGSDTFATTQSSGGGGSTGSVDSTGFVDSGTGESSAADSSTGAPEPAVTCPGEICARTCGYEQDVDLGDGEQCECEVGVYSEMFVACALPPLCADKGYFCRMQALRYGIVGTFEVAGGIGFDGDASSTIEIFGDDRVRTLFEATTYTCCGGAAVELQVFEYYPARVRPIDDPFWAECLADVPARSAFEFPGCFLQSKFSERACEEGPLEACPDVALHEPGCDDACPMANDGVCDEPAGTGLCADGCDPIDCACPEDVSGVCDEISADGGACPLGSDADDCPGDAPR